MTPSQPTIAAALALAALLPASAQAAAPSTGFETRGGSSWTTLSEEQAFIAAIDSVYGSRASVATVGRSLKGRPINLLTLGAPRTQAEIAAGSLVLLVCTQHGNEPAGREGCLQKARDHAASTSTSTLLVIPTANPDGVAATTRTNAGGLDINRDHRDLDSPEARTIKAVQEGWRPDITMDMHEYSDAHRVNGERVEHGIATNPAVSSTLRHLSYSLVYDWVEPGLRSAGFLTGAYGSSGTYETLKETSGLRRSVPVLVETPREGSLSRTGRVRAHYVAIGQGLRMRVARTDDLAAATR